MPLVKFVSSVHPANAIGSVILNPSEDGKDRVLQLGGDPLELSDAEFNSLRGELNLEVLKAEESHEAPVTPVSRSIPVESTNPTTQSASGSIDLKTPAQGS